MFFQEGPKFSSPYRTDEILKGLLKFFSNSSQFSKIDQDLEAFSKRIEREIESLGLQAESSPPVHIPYDPWGRRIDEVKTSKAWSKLKKISAEEKLISLGYERDNEGGHRLHQFAKLYLFHPSSAFYSCPLAMTDGAAKLIEVHGDRELKDGPFKSLTSNCPEKFWTSGQWMTERAGGSDVGNSETIARKEDGMWKLYGVKWFTSAVDADMAMTLARIEDEKGKSAGGSRGLSLFYVLLRD